MALALLLDALMDALMTAQFAERLLSSAKSNLSLMPEEDSRLTARFLSVRNNTEELARPLSAEDCQISVTEDTSPAKWHLAHTSWFFAEFVLKNHKSFPESFAYLFNSYYRGLGEFLPKPSRRHLSRPSLDEVYAYRKKVTEQVHELLLSASSERRAELSPIVQLGIAHEEQHQELLLMDTLRNFFDNPLLSKYREGTRVPRMAEASDAFLQIPAGFAELGAWEEGFAFDNERPRHRVWMESYAICERMVTNGEYLEFIEAGGYEDPRLWLSDGWDWKEREKTRAPLYWLPEGRRFSLHGAVELELEAPVSHLSYFEADAYARWREARLPTEAEWERAAPVIAGEEKFLRLNALLPMGHGFHGNLWQWTQSAYQAYRGYRGFPGALAEYNGKFMSQQYVLRGGSYCTPREHYRATYRNFFYPHQRWQFAGLRLAKDLL